jgi:signal transduction histidine kinase
MDKTVLLYQLPQQIPTSVSAKAKGLEGLFLASELLVVTAFLMVAAILFYLTFKREDRERRLVLLLFGVIGLMGGVVHLFSFLVNDRWLEPLLIVKLILGLIANVAAVMLFKAIPNLLAIPSFSQLSRTNVALREQIEERQKIEVALQEAKQTLEKQVQERSAQWITANRDLEEEIKKRQKAEKKLITKNYQLVKKNADLDDFVYYASRDLKGPVLNVTGLVQAIREDLPPDNPELNQLFARLDDSVARIHRKLNNLAEVSRIQKPMEEAQMGMVSFAEVLEQVKARLAEPLQASGAELQVDFTGAPEVFFSRDNLYSLLYNLLSNSIKYREPQRPLQVSLSSALEDGYIVLRARDNGIGIDTTKYGPQLFSLFRRFHDHVEGSGVGLYIIKRIMENNRGKVEVESVIGQGTTFQLYFVNHLKATATRA